MPENPTPSPIPPVPPQSSPSATITANVELTIRGGKLNLQIKVPTRHVHPAEMLPLYRTLAENLTRHAIKEVEGQGHRISCRAGCGACCRQLVPISALEAREIAKLVDRLPEPRRSQVLGRFAEARRRMDEAGLLPRLSEPHQFGREVMVHLGEEYWSVQVACPFLENESCSIHPDRPITCREYFVVNPAAECARPKPETIQAIVPPAGPVSPRVPAWEKSPDGREIPWVPLILALDFVQKYRDEPPPRPAPELVGEFFERFNYGPPQPHMQGPAAQSPMAHGTPPQDK